MSVKKYKDEVADLVRRGDILYYRMIYECDSDQFEQSKSGKKLLKVVKDAGSVISSYQSWYSESLAVISHILPDRVEDFVGYYKPIRARKEIDHGTYTISDYLLGSRITRGSQVIVDHKAAIPKFKQQVGIIRSLEKRFESSLFDIKMLLEADVYDNELSAAEALSSKGFYRAAGAVAGVVLEGHLKTVCSQHKIRIPKVATLGKLTSLLKDNDIVDTPVWRRLQHLGDLRNLCDHRKTKEPTTEDADDLIAGVKKAIKTIF